MIFEKPFAELGILKENSDQSKIDQNIQESEVISSIPIKAPKEEKQLILVLDLDETLIHYEESANQGLVHLRPHLTEFLQEMHKHYEIVAFTAAQQSYADQVFSIIDPLN